MDEIEEKRVFGDRAGKTELLVAAGIGVLSVDVSEDLVGRFGVAHRCEPVDVAAGTGLVAVATPTDVLVRRPTDGSFEATAFGPAVAVGIDDGVIAAGPDGRLARLDGPDPADAEQEAPGSGGWTDVGTLDAEVRAIDPPLLATAEGVHRLPGLDYVGLADVYDVAAGGPLAATGDGLYSLGNGWMDELDGVFRVAAAAGDRAHAATDAAFYERRSGEWTEIDLPADSSIVDVAYGEVVYAVTDDGDLLARGEGGWRAHPLGVDGVVGCAAV